MESGAKAATDSEAGCRVDWSWLAARRIASADSTLDKIVITFEDGETLTIQASLWKGQAFLAFSPWKAPS